MTDELHQDAKKQQREYLINLHVKTIAQKEKEIICAEKKKGILREQIATAEKVLIDLHAQIISQNESEIICLEKEKEFLLSNIKETKGALSEAKKLKSEEKT